MSFEEQLREAGQQPNADTRQWTSFGIVCPDSSPSQRSVRFNDVNGNPLAHGVLVDVKLQPSGIELPCRVANNCAAQSEGEYHPFVAGDEVQVVINEGDEANGGVIIGRLNQSFDTFPAQVAGQDVTKNTIAFKRLTAPYILESGTSIMLRCANTGAALTIDNLGHVWLQDGDKSLLAMTSDVVSLQLLDKAVALQFDPSKKQAALMAGHTTLVVDDSKSKFESNGLLAFNVGGNTGYNHATSIEALTAVLQAFSAFLMTGLTTAAATLSAAPGGVAFATSIGVLATALNGPGMAAILTTASTTPPSPANLAAIKAALSIPKPPFVPYPGIGSPAVLID